MPNCTKNGCDGFYWLRFYEKRFFKSYLGAVQVLGKQLGESRVQGLFIIFF